MNQTIESQRTRGSSRKEKRTHCTEQQLGLALIGKCTRCNRSLKTQESIRLGLGPICVTKSADDQTLDMFKWWRGIGHE